MAYMLEGWALRFVVELFRHFHVVFIGYSLEDPTMRYLVRALAAAREENSQQFKEPYAFTSYGRGEEMAARVQAKRKWVLTGITPLPYDKSEGHQQLWNALQAWADDHRQGIAGRRQTVARLGQHPPAPGEADSTVLEMAWALKDPDVARYFANLKGDRCPKSGWIAALQEKGLFGLPTGWTEDGQGMGASIVSWQLNDHVRLHPATHELGHWISRCLDSQDAIDWVLREGSVLHSELRDLIDSQLSSRETTEISPAVRKLWRILAELGYAHMLSEKNQSDRFGNYGRPRVAAGEAFTTRIFLDRLRPVPVFTVKPDYSRREGKRDPERPSDWYEINMELIGIRGDYEIKEFRKRAEDWKNALAVMADDLTTRLGEAMDWFGEFGLASQDGDTTHIEYRSISPHDQNKNARTWTQLIALVREAHDALRSCGDKTGALRLERRWRSLAYPVFRRLALHAATEPPDSDVELGLEVLLEGGNPALWDLNSMRETLRFLRKRGADFKASQLTDVTEAILEGPPRQMYRADLSEEDWERRRDHQILLRLYKLIESGVSLPSAAQERFERIQGDEPWEPRGNRSEEFRVFMFSGPAAHRFGDEERIEDFAGMSTNQFVRWSEIQEGKDDFAWDSGGGWDEFVKKEFPSALELLKDAAEQNVWPIPLWYTVLGESYQYERKKRTDKREEEIAKLLIDMSSQALIALADPVAKWLEHARPKLRKRQRQELWRLNWDACLKGDLPEGNLDIDSAVNHAGGILGHVLYDELTERIPNVYPGQNTGFPSLLRRDFERLVESEHPSVKLARVRMAPMLFAVYRIDPDWTKRTFFSRMDPENHEAFDTYLWEAYFWTARCSVDLLAAFKKLFLGVLQKRELIPERVHDNAITLFVRMAIPTGRGIDSDDSKSILRRLGPQGLTYAAMALRDILAGAGDKSLALWRDSVGPWFEKVWPMRPTDRSPELSARLAWMACEAGEAFPDAVNAIKDAITQDEHNFVLFELTQKEEECGLVSRYPSASLVLIRSVSHDGSDKKLLRKLLELISKADPKLVECDCFRRLSERLD